MVRLGPQLDPGDLGILMPMYLHLDSAGIVRSAGPTLTRLLPDSRLTGRPFFEVFSVRRPGGIETLADLDQYSGKRLLLAFRDEPHTSFRAVPVPSAPAGGTLLNLAFGLSVLDAIRVHDLHSSDFAPTDPTIEMLYLIEAKTAVMDELRRLNGRLRAAMVAAEEQAFTDTLTGLKNRRALEHVVERYIAQGRAFALVHLDLDHFKVVNDTHGHAAGDFVLQAVAAVMVQETRDKDTLVRAGGDEFVLVLPDLTSASVLNPLTKRIISRIEQPVAFGDEICHVSASAGVTLSVYYSPPTRDGMMRDADDALYNSKREGRGRVKVLEAPVATIPPSVPEEYRGRRDEDLRAG